MSSKGAFSMANDASHTLALERARSANPGWTAADVAGLEDSMRRIAEMGDAASALELFGRTWRAWLTAGAIESGRGIARLALGIPGSAEVTPWYCRALYADGLLAFRRGDNAGSLERNREALAVARETGDTQGQVEALTGLARVALRAGDYARVVALAHEARELAATVDQPALGAGPLHLQAAGVRLLEDYRAARDLYLENLELSRRLGNSAGVAMEEHNLGWVSLHLDDADAAEGHFARARQGPGDAYGRAWQTLNSAAVALLRGRVAEARDGYASGKAQLDALGQELDPDDRFEMEWMRSKLEEAA